MSLLQLPNEIIEQVLQHVRNADLDCFAASCWSLRVLATDRLREHAKRKAEELVILYSGDKMGISSTRRVTYSTDQVNPARLIQKLLQDDAFPYVQDLFMTFALPDEWDGIDSVTVNSWEDYRSKRTEQFHGIKAGLQHSDMLLNKEYNIDRLVGRLLDEEHEALLPIFFTLARQLRTITLRDCNSIPQEIVDMLQDIASQAKDIKTPNQPLSRLTDVTIQSDFQYDFFDLGQIEPFLRLSSVNSLVMHMGQISPWEGRNSLDFKSSLSSLKLSGYFKLKVLKQLLGNISNLREFRCLFRTYPEENEEHYKPYRGPYHGKKMPFNPRPIRDRLLQHAHYSLEHLEIRYQFSYKYTVLSLGSLRGFKKLQTAGIGSDMFSDPDREERADGTETYSQFSFTHMLPSTIRRITILEPAVRVSRVLYALEGILTWKRLKFPRLTEIKFPTAHRGTGSGDSELIVYKAMLKDMGISLVVGSDVY